jgi:hypothetical protein
MVLPYQYIFCWLQLFSVLIQSLAVSVEDAAILQFFQQTTKIRTA